MSHSPSLTDSAASINTGRLEGFAQYENGPSAGLSTPPEAEGSSRRLSKADLAKRFRLDEFVAEKLITSIAFVSLATIVMIFVFVFREALPILQGGAKMTAPTIVGESETYGDEYVAAAPSTAEWAKERSESVETAGGEGEAGWSNLFGTAWMPVSAHPRYGILPLVVGSFKVTLLAIMIASPVAILAALFTAAFAPRWAKEFLKPSIEILAGIPSVVIGFFTLVVLASVLQEFFGYEYRLNAFVGGVAMSFAVIPIVYTVAEDALAAVPKFTKEASLALGATKWQTALFVTLPAATPGVFAAILLGFGRAFGETMIVLMATGNAAVLSFNFLEPVRTLSATIGAEMAEVVFGDTHYTVLFFLGAVLFAFTFTLNAAAEIFIRQRLLKRFRGL